MTGTIPGGRTRETEEFSNLYVVHPVSRILVRRLAKWGVHPNAVSLAGMVCGAAAAAAYFHYERIEMAVLGFVCMFGWHVMDGADGQLARVTGKTSETGKVLDGLCDHMTFVLVYVSLAVAMMPELGAWVWIPVVLAGISHAIQSSAYEFQRQSYDYWVRRKESAKVPSQRETRMIVRRAKGAARAFAWLNYAYVYVQHFFVGLPGQLRTTLEAANEAGEETRLRASDEYRAIELPVVRRWSVLSSNYRTLAIFVAAAVGLPVIYFVYELTFLNLILVVLLQDQRSSFRALAFRLQKLALPQNGRPPADAVREFAADEVAKDRRR